MASVIEKINGDNAVMYSKGGKFGNNNPNSTNNSHLVSEIIDVVGTELENLSPFSNITEKDGYTISNVIQVGNENVTVASCEGKESRLYVTDSNNKLIGKIAMNTDYKIVSSAYDEKNGTITVTTENGKTITYSMDRIKASIKLADKYEHTKIGKYYNTDGDKYVEVAHKELGKDYVYGAAGPDAYDCSGLVGYVVTGKHERIGTTYDIMTWPEVSNPIPGDVCVNEGHTGVYIGDGQMIHAADYGIGVIIGPVQDGMKYVRYDGRNG